MMQLVWSPSERILSRRPDVLHGTSLHRAIARVPYGTSLLITPHPRSSVATGVRTRTPFRHEAGVLSDPASRRYRSVYFWVIYTELCGRCANGAEPVRTRVAAGIPGRPWP